METPSIYKNQVIRILAKMAEVQREKAKKINPEKDFRGNIPFYKGQAELFEAAIFYLKNQS